MCSVTTHSASSLHCLIHWGICVYYYSHHWLLLNHYHANQNYSDLIAISYHNFYPRTRSAKPCHISCIAEIIWLCCVKKKKIPTRQKRWQSLSTSITHVLASKQYRQRHISHTFSVCHVYLQLALSLTCIYPAVNGHFTCSAYMCNCYYN